ncbi:hypothetical protein Cob_v008312 [Colletotrichum orbiculare MAFF 240422]|uniref:Uncharacterized protein n=1 Tax=Colletotrichum orbiculare (strain 104-T / ATCC 96160 / CBS 514.97 / LARS 414 / MAFF 240422) TaxID=1213857 RepID=N4VZN1_COLOR|nr:hypothetical protein Cob_v008312 [Colletotrichum orbiculare MAFF 240422]
MVASLPRQTGGFLTVVPSLFLSAVFATSVSLGTRGALLRYKPLDFNRVHPGFRIVFSAWDAVVVFGWTNIQSPEKVAAGPVEYPDFLKHKYKDNMVFIYRNDDEAVLYAFDLE